MPEVLAGRALPLWRLLLLHAQRPQAARKSLPTDPEQTKIMILKRYRRATPDQSGWWLWKENKGRGFREPVRLLIAGGAKRSEVATDSCLAEILGLEYDPEAEPGDMGSMNNYWEMTDTKEMPGVWMLDEAIDLKGRN